MSNQSENNILVLEKENLTLNGIIDYLSELISKFPDARTGSNLSYTMVDIGLSAFAMFYMQSPSFLAYQTAMKLKLGHSNADSIFRINKIPSDNHVRDRIDPVPPGYLFPVFKCMFFTLYSLNYLDQYRSYNGNVLCAFDGTHFFSSQKICCENCNTKEHKNGTITYFHSVVTPVIVAPLIDKVIALDPEFITKQEGYDKQDCENMAAKRWLEVRGRTYSDAVSFRITFLGDDLYAKQPMCEAILAAGFDFILICKPASHQTLFEWVNELDQAGGVQTVTEKRWNGKSYEIDTYRFVNQVPLRDTDDALYVNWCELTTIDASSDKIIYKNSFVTNFTITKDDVKEIVRDGRARWKVENENNNVLKTKGYHLEHNFGHGEENLSNTFLTFNLIAFLVHTVLELVDEKYKLIREVLPTRKTFFDDIRALTRYIDFKDWDSLLKFMLVGLEIEYEDTS